MVVQLEYKEHEIVANLGVLLLRHPDLFCKWEAHCPACHWLLTVFYQLSHIY